MNESNSTGETNHTCDCRLVYLFDTLDKYIGLPVLVSGIICNILALFTLRQPKLKESPFIHLMGLTVADLMAIILIFINQFAVRGNRTWVRYTCYIYFPLTNAGALFCVWIMVVMTLERCIFMQFPLWAPIWCTNSSAKFKIVLVFSICFTVSIPRFFWHQAINSSANLNVSDNETTVYKNSEYYHVGDNINGSLLATVLSWIYCFIHNFLPVTILLALNSFLIYKIRAQNKRRIELGIQKMLQLGRTQEQTRLTITLIAITGIYIIFVLPSAFADPNIAKLLFRKDSIELHLFQRTSNFLTWLNLSFNFLMYTFVNVKFMRAFRKMFTRWYSRLYGCVACLRVSQARIQKTNSSTAAYSDRRTAEYPLRRHPGPQSARRACSSRLLTSRGFI